MKKRVACVAAWMAVLALLGAAARAADWDDSRYEKFTPETFGAYAPANRAISFQKIDYELLSAALFYESNLQRTKNGKEPFLYSPALREAAFGHAKDMAEKDFHSHINPEDPKKRTVVERLELVGIRRCVMSENVAFVPGRKYPITKATDFGGEIEVDTENVPAAHTYISFARQVVETWMASPGHRKNLLSDQVQYLGCGAYYYRKELLTPQGKVVELDYFKVCQNFASQRGPVPEK